MESKMITHEEAMRIARQDPEFIREERKIEPINQIAIAVYSLRKKIGFSQKQLAKKAKTHQTRISKIENGELNPRISTIIDIAEALGCKISITFNECSDDRLEALKNSDYFYFPEFTEEDELLSFSKNQQINSLISGAYSNG